MNMYREFVLEALGDTAQGFGRPKRQNTKKPTKEQLANWRGRSEKWQQAYLEKYPNSMFRDQPKRGSIITRSKKLSQSVDAKQMVSNTTDYLKSLGVNNKGTGIDKAKEALGNIKKFLGSEKRDAFITTAQDKFKGFLGKLSKKDQLAALDEAKAIADRPNIKPSRVLNSKDKKGVLPGLIGMAIGVAVIGGLATGFLPPDVMAFIGIKALDAAVESIRGLAGQGGLTTLLAGSVISDFFRSKDSDDYVENVAKGLKKKVGDEDEDEEEPEEEENNNNTASPANTNEKVNRR